MEQAITIGTVVWFVLIAGGALGALGIAVWVLSVIADGFKH